ncbi:MAG: GIY-YIG nuclease family protein [Acidobacteriota bacterium]|nr:GIY-YIG nuclease family protein [Acidobacteriota bacterium]
MAASKRFVYILRSESNPARYYTGLTSDMHLRLADHNEGSCRHTSSGRPWKLDVLVEFADEPRAVAFERYLKSGSGGAFAARHLREARSSNA